MKKLDITPMTIDDKLSIAIRVPVFIVYLDDLAVCRRDGFETGKLG